MTIQQLAEQAWEQYQRHRQSPFVVKPAIPILYFGDLEQYLRSPIRIVTVGLNPSDNEFPSASPYLRFPGADQLETEFGPDVLLGSLNDYFKKNPYSKWFNMSFEKILNGMKASFYAGHRSVALHTDLCSVLATSPTWSKLSPNERKALEKIGIKMWHDLIRVLQPNVILMSIAKGYLNHLQFPMLHTWKTAYRVERSNPYEIKKSVIQIDKGMTSVVYWGKAAQTPFGNISFDEKVRLGAFIREEIGANEGR